MTAIAARWSASQKAWYVPDNAMEELRRVLVLRAYSSNTQKTYMTEFTQLLYVLNDVPVQSLDATRLKSYFLYCIEKLRISEKQLHSRINAIKFYWEQVLHRPKIFAEIPRPKKPSSLPKVLSKEDIGKCSMRWKTPNTN